MNPNFNVREEHFINRAMSGIKTICPPGSPVYYEMLIKLIEQQYVSNPMNTTGGNALLKGIVEKIAYAQLSEELEEILIEAQAIELDEVKVGNTKSESMKVSKVNSSRGHILIKAALQSSPEPLSRTDLANVTNLRVSAVCARVKELLEDGSIRVAGTKKDVESNRIVEVLEVA